MPSDFKPTLTHARLRASQGDASGAREILERLLAGDPGNAEARRLLDDLIGLGNRRPGEAAPRALAPPRPARAGELAARFRDALGRNGPGKRRARIRKLEAWLVRIGGRV